MLWSWSHPWPLPPLILLIWSSSKFCWLYLLSMSEPTTSLPHDCCHQGSGGRVCLVIMIPSRGVDHIPPLLNTPRWLPVLRRVSQSLRWPTGSYTASYFPSSSFPLDWLFQSHWLPAIASNTRGTLLSQGPHFLFPLPEMLSLREFTPCSLPPHLQVCSQKALSLWGLPWLPCLKL